MTFNIHQSVFDRDGMPRERVVSQYQKQLLELFQQSPEGQTLQAEGIDANWSGPMLDFAINYLGKTPPELSPTDLREILFDLYPRKLSVQDDEAPAIIRELQLFWQFLQRQFHLANAAACLKVLDDQAARKLKKEMSNPANFGIAKSFVMMGLERGFDMTSQEGLDAWMATYNAELTAGTGPRIPLPGERNQNARMIQTEIKPKFAWKSRKKKRKKK